MNENFPLLTHDLAMRASACDFAFWAHRIAALRSLSGNPYGAEVLQFGGATALMLAGAGNDANFNRAGNISAADIPHLDAILDWYCGHNVRCRFDIVPSSDQGALLRALAERGYYQSGFKSVMISIPYMTVPLLSGVSTRIVSTEDAEIFADMYVNGFDVPLSSDAHAYLWESVRRLVGHPAARCLLAFVDDKPAGMGVLYLHERTGYLAAGATLAAFRGYGCQKALLHERIMLAVREGCDLVVGHTQVGSVSQQNVEKVGLRLAYTKVLWTAL